MPEMISEAVVYLDLLELEADMLPPFLSYRMDYLGPTQRMSAAG